MSLCASRAAIGKLHAERFAIHCPPAVYIFALAIFSNAVLVAVLPSATGQTSEVIRIATSIAQGHGFSSPFAEPTGPSAWISPAFPYLLAAIFRVFGVMTTASYWAIVVMNIAVHALTCVLLFWSVSETFGPRAGWYSACSLASFPLLFYPLVLLHVLGNVYTGQGLFIPPNLIWYTHLTELAIVLLIWLTLHPPRWFVYGVVWGLVSLLNPTLLVLAPVFFLWLVCRGKSWRNIAMTVAVIALCATPWLVRNYLAFGRVIFIRDNLGVELKVGNQPGHRGLWDGEIHPDRNPQELERMVQLGEANYAQAACKDALNTMRAHPVEFLGDTLLRMRYWWFGIPMQSHRLSTLRFLKYLPFALFSILSFCGVGLVLLRKNESGYLFVAVLVFYPVIYYVTHAFDGFLYQYPIQPEMLALAACAFFVRAPVKAAAGVSSYSWSSLATEPQYLVKSQQN